MQPTALAVIAQSPKQLPGALDSDPAAAVQATLEQGQDSMADTNALLTYQNETFFNAQSFFPKCAVSLELGYDAAAKDVQAVNGTFDWALKE